MTSFAVVAAFEFVDGAEAAISAFFRNGQHVVEHEPVTTVWFAYRLGPTSYGAFAAFASEADRDALLAAGGPRSARENASLFARPPTFELVDIIASRAAGPNNLT